jgi:hypothetical protein
MLLVRAVALRRHTTTFPATAAEVEPSCLARLILGRRCNSQAGQRFVCFHRVSSCFILLLATVIQLGKASVVRRGRCIRNHRHDQHVH